MGFTMLTRDSNYLPNSSTAYRLDTEHVSFSIAPLSGVEGASVEVSADQLGDILLSRAIGASALLASESRSCINWPTPLRAYMT
jgi:hypothetical protein